MPETGFDPGWGKSPGEANSNPLQYSCWSIPWTEEDGKIQSIVLRRAGHDLATKPETMLHRHVPTSNTQYEFPQTNLQTFGQCSYLLHFIGPWNPDPQIISSLSRGCWRGLAGKVVVIHDPLPPGGPWGWVKHVANMTCVNGDTSIHCPWKHAGLARWVGARCFTKQDCLNVVSWEEPFRRAP